MSPAKGKDGNPCANHCPAKCGSEEMPCGPKGKDDNECFLPESCEPQYRKLFQNGFTAL